MVRGAKSAAGLVLLTATLALAAGAAVLGSDATLERGFGKALAQSHAGLTFDTGAVQAAALTAGDEGFWLTQADVQSPTPFAKALAVGDRITIAGRDGAERRLEVVDLKAVGTPAKPGAHGRLLLVSCRVTDQGRPEAMVRFLIEAGSNPARSARAKAL